MKIEAWCNDCKSDVAPHRKFHWLFFILISPLMYLPLYLLKKKTCPVCGGMDFSPPKNINPTRQSQFTPQADKGIGLTTSLDELQKLGNLRNQGIVTEEEFEEKKRQLLATRNVDWSEEERRA